MKLEKIISISGQIELLSGLHIGGGNDAMHIGGTDNPVIKHPLSNEPYIPGSSLKGKMRSLLEWRAGLVEYNQGKPIGYKQITKGNMPEAQKVAASQIIKLFGISGGDQLDLDEAMAIGPTRIVFRDATLSPEWVQQVKSEAQLFTETKFENTINRISGTAEHPRNTERVPSGATFSFSVQVKVLDTDNEAELISLLLNGLKLIELDALGGSGSRGYGRVKFHIDGPLAESLNAADPFAKVA